MVLRGEARDILHRAPLSSHSCSEGQGSRPMFMFGHGGVSQGPGDGERDYVTHRVSVALGEQPHQLVYH